MALGKADLKPVPVHFLRWTSSQVKFRSTTQETSHYVPEKKQLAIFNENTESLHVIENKTVIIFVRGEGTKKCGGKK
jgi:hypothetical protein